MSYSSINRVVLIGRLTQDPELRALPSGTAVCSLRIACNTSRKDPEGEYQEKPNYFNVSAFGGLGESVSRYMRKGSRVAVDGRLEWHEWETAEGVRRQAVEVVAESVQFLDGRGEQGRQNGAVYGSSDGEGSTGGDDGAHPMPGHRQGGEERELVGVGAGVEDDLVF